MRILLLLSLLMAAPLVWEAYSSASANRGTQVPEVLPAMKIQIRLGGEAPRQPETMKPGEILYFKQGRRTE